MPKELTIHDLAREQIPSPATICCGLKKNIGFSKIVEPHLTARNYPGNNIGEIAARNLIGLVKNERSMHETNTVIVKPEIFTGKSSFKENLSTT